MGEVIIEIKGGTGKGMSWMVLDLADKLERRFEEK